VITGELDSAPIRAAETEGFLVLKRPLDSADLYALLAVFLNRSSDPHTMEDQNVVR
jgi:hypothetical protein